MATEVTAGIAERFAELMAARALTAQKTPEPTVIQTGRPTQEQKTTILDRFISERQHLGIDSLFADLEKTIPGIRTSVSMKTPKDRQTGLREEAIVVDSQDTPNQFAAHQTYSLFSVGSDRKIINSFMTVALTVDPETTELKVKIGSIEFGKEDYCALEAVERGQLIFEAFAASLHGLEPYFPPQSAQLPLHDDTQESQTIEAQVDSVLEEADAIVSGQDAAIEEPEPSRSRIWRP